MAEQLGGKLEGLGEGVRELTAQVLVLGAATLFVGAYLLRKDNEQPIEREARKKVEVDQAEEKEPHPKEAEPTLERQPQKDS